MKLKLIRTLIHLFTLRGQRGRYFSKKDLHEIAQAIASSEAKHRAEIRVAIESSFSLVQIWQNLLSRARALDIFSQYHIWDTEENNGVLIYLLLAEHRLEIIADRGIDKKLGEEYWNQLSSKIADALKEKKYKQGILEAVETVSKDMIILFPKQEGGDPNELSDEVILI